LSLLLDIILMKLLQKSGSVSVVIFRCNCLFDNVLGQFVVVGEASIFRHAHEVRIRCCCPCFRFWLEISVVSWPCGRIYRLRLASDRVSHNNHAVSIQLCSWRRVLAIFIADFLHNIDLVALAHTSSSDQFATSVWALLRTVDLVFFSDTIANCIYILAIWADCLDFNRSQRRKEGCKTCRNQCKEFRGRLGKNQVLGNAVIFLDIQ